MIAGVLLAPRARVGGRNRADLQSSARKIARIFDRKIAQFRCRTCAQDAREARRLIPNAFDAVPCTRALSGMLFEALGVCRAPKLRRNSAQISRFQRKITVDESKISRPKASLSSRKPVHHQHRASNDRRCLFGASCACRWPQRRCFAKFCTQNRANFDRKIAQFWCRTCAQDAREARRLIPNAFDAVPCTLALSGMLWQAPGACRAAKLRRNSSKISRVQPKIAVFECKIPRQNASLSSEKPSHRAQCAWYDHRCWWCASCAHQWPQSR